MATEPRRYNPNLIDTPSMKDAREFVKENVEDGGCICPTCGRLARAYRRRFTAEMLAFLKALQAARAVYPGNKKPPPLHVRKFLVRNAEAEKAASDGSLLVHWGLVTSPKVGYYDITPAGVDFLNGRSEAQLYAVIFDGRLLCFEGPWIDAGSDFTSFSKKETVDGKSKRDE